MAAALNKESGRVFPSGTSGVAHPPLGTPLRRGGLQTAGGRRGFAGELQIRTEGGPKDFGVLLLHKGLSHLLIIQPFPFFY